MRGGGWWGSVGWGGGEGVGEWWVAGGGEGEAEGEWWFVGGLFAVGGGGHGEEEIEGECVCGGHGEREWGWAMDGRIMARSEEGGLFARGGKPPLYKRVTLARFGGGLWYSRCDVIACPAADIPSYLNDSCRRLSTAEGVIRSHFSHSTGSKHPPSPSNSINTYHHEVGLQFRDILCYLTLPQHTCQKDLGKRVH